MPKIINNIFFLPFLLLNIRFDADSHKQSIERVQKRFLRYLYFRVLNQTQDHRNRVLLTVAKEFQAWRVMVRKMKAIYHTLNLFNLDVTKKCLIGECWAPVADLPIVREALDEGGRTGGSSINSFLNVIENMEDPPTFNRTNKFTHAFQVLIDSYGVSAYRELNPALYTIITFPFLFAVMFGDAGHGLILFIFGLTMVLQEKKFGKKKITNEIAAIFFGGRYIVLLMGIFSMYTGMIYNDIFSKSFRIFYSSWENNYNISTVQSNAALQMNPADDFSGNPYPFGLDPVWQVATANKIIYLNSFKMKLSIVFGVIHMMFGISLSVLNHRHFKRSINIIFEFIPQILFMAALFAYLAVLIILKWVLYSSKNDEIWQGNSCAPNVLIIFINMFLFKEAEVKPGCKAYMFDGQHEAQIAFLLIALLSIPVMLFGKPIYLICTRPKKNHMEKPKNNGDLNHGFELQSSDPEVAQPPPNHKADDSEDEEHESFGEIMIHQSIHTIEYVLSTISHTASYLRLWALSLAHAQLSDVLWTMLFSKVGLTMDLPYVGGVLIFFLFAAWATLTLSILVTMEGLSAFLHTLRLHWVEFMSKFFSGTGYIFEPFSFKTALEAEEDNE